jgi:preprotein translocase subunit SecA
VRNQRGQLEQAATAKAQQAAVAQAAALSQQNAVSPAFGGQQQPAADAAGPRGAFGQRQAGPPQGQQPPQNRAQRRAQEKGKRH